MRSEEERVRSTVFSIAWAVIEHVANPKLLGAKTLFATHYHELTEA